MTHHSLLTKTLSLFLCLCIGGAACSADDGGGTNASMGDVSLDPSKPENMTMNDAVTTTDTCGGADDCATWYCRCESGSVVNSRTCDNGVCLGPGAICQGSCEDFNAGDWTGFAGGGVKQEPPKNDPPASGNNDTGGGGGSGSTCASTIADSSSSCDQCTRRSCCDEAVRCEGNSSCIDYFDCHTFDGFSRDDCDLFHPGGAADYDDLVVCLLDSCLDECS